MTTRAAGESAEIIGHTPEATTANVCDAFTDCPELVEPLTTPERAAMLDCSRRTVLNKLYDLEAEGEIGSKGSVAARRCDRYRSRVNSQPIIEIATMTATETPHRRVEPDDPVPEVIWCLIDTADENQIVGTFLTRKAAKDEAVEKATERDLMTEDFPVVALHFKDLQDLYQALKGGIRADVLVPTTDGFREFREFMDSPRETDDQ